MTTAPSERNDERDDNNPETIKLELDDSFSVVDMVEEIEAMDTVKSLQLCCFSNPHQATKWSSKEAEAIYQAIGSLDQLEELTLSLTNHEPVRMLAVMMNQPQCRLKHLCLQWMQLDGSQQSFEEFATVLTKQQSLECVELRECHLAPASRRMSEPAATSVDALMMALTSLPHLQTLIVQSSDKSGSMGLLSTHTLEALCCSSNLHTLDLSAFRVANHQLVAMARSLHNNAQLQQLYLGEVNLETSRAFPITSLVHMDSNLTNLHFRLPADGNNKGMIEAFMTDVANSLHKNTSLKELDVRLNGQVQMIGPRIEKAFALMLRYNNVLQQLHLNGYIGRCRKAIDFYLRLNKIGRRHFVENFEFRSKWMELTSDDCHLIGTTSCNCCPTTDLQLDDASHSILPRKRKLQEIL